MGAATTAPGELRDERDPPLWPPEDPALDGRLLARESLGGLIDRWYWTTRCFFGPIESYDDEDLARLFAHRVILAAAFGGVDCANGPTFEDQLCEGIRETLMSYLPERFRATLRRDPGAAFERRAKAFLQLDPTDQLMVVLYDYDSLDGGRVSRHGQGRFRAEDLQRLFRLPKADAIRKRASRALARFKEQQVKLS